MKEYTSENPTFSESIQIVERTDLVNADNKNAAPQQLLQNDLVLKRDVDALKGSLSEHSFAYDEESACLVVMEGSTGTGSTDADIDSIASAVQKKIFSTDNDLTAQDIADITDGE